MSSSHLMASRMRIGRWASTNRSERFRTVAWYAERGGTVRPFVLDPLSISDWSLAPDFTEHILGHVDRHLGRHRQGDGVAGPAIDFDQLGVLADAQLGEVGMVAQVADEDVLQIAAHVVDHVGH